LGWRFYSWTVLRFVLVVALIAGLVYLLMWTLEQRRANKPVKPRRPARRAARPVAPDDDEEFLRSLRERPKDSPDS
jgi:hypothetical protein